MKNKPDNTSKKSKLDAHNAAMGNVTRQATEEAKNNKSSGPGKTKDDTELICRNLGEVEPEPVKWLWPGFIALGKATMIAGNPGLGKSQITTYIAGIVSTGGHWPIEGTKSEQGRVLFITAEDDAADTIVPRLIAVKADISQCDILDGAQDKDNSGRVVQRSFNLRDDLKKLNNKVNELGNVRLIIIDPISAYLGGVDSHKNADVRALLSELGEFAQKNNLSILCVSHLNKSNNQDALARISGSGAFSAAPRAAFLVAKDQNKPDRRYFVISKTNIAKDGIGLAFSISSCVLDDGIETSKIEWEPELIYKTADEVLSEIPKRKDNGEIASAKRFLISFLSDGSRSAKEVEEAAEEEGYSKSTIKRAKKAIEIKFFKKEYGNGKGWFWMLNSSKKIEGAHEGAQPYTQEMSPFDGCLENKGIDTCSTYQGAHHNMDEPLGKNVVIFNAEPEEINESVL